MNNTVFSERYDMNLEIIRWILFCKFSWRASRRISWTL